MVIYCHLCMEDGIPDNLYKFHMETTKHKNKITSSTKILNKDYIIINDDNFYCYSCNYVCIHVQNMNKHCKTKKHIRAKELHFNNEHPVASDPHYSIFKCEYCYKDFNNKVSVLRHQKRSCKERININLNNNKDTCDIETNNNCDIETNNNCDIETNAELFKAKQDVEALELELMNVKKEKIKEEIKAIKEGHPLTQPQTINNNTVNTVVNQQFNLQVYLNEDCKDAINISEFTKSIQITMEDLLYIGNNGWSEGMTKLIVDNLNKLDATKRPIQCSDVKRDVTYVKDGEWKKDTETDLIEKSIQQLNKEQYKAIGEWTKEKYPPANSSAADQFHKVLSNLTPGDEPTRNMNKVKRNIRNATAINKSIS